jgi:bifunctional non-homologous end joining protein LigD
MLATLVDKPFDSDDWLYEIKWDGYRAITFLDGKSLRLVSISPRPILSCTKFRNT